MNLSAIHLAVHKKAVFFAANFFMPKNLKCPKNVGVYWLCQIVECGMSGMLEKTKIDRNLGLAV